MIPLKLEPVCKYYLWGGNKLKTDFHKQSELETVGESWELSCHNDGMTKIHGTNMTLDSYIKNSKTNLLGKNCDEYNDFPIMIKLIDAKDDLSIQVHPNDQYAMEVEGGFGKTEMWYVLDCDEKAYIYYGFNKTITKEEYKERIGNNTIMEVLNKVYVKKGDVFFVPAGTVHAICKGVLVAEIQQNSNITYRIYDYNRKDLNGQERECHVDKAIDVLILDKMDNSYNKEKDLKQIEGVSLQQLAECKYFNVMKLNLDGTAEFEVDEMSFQSLLVVDGDTVLINNKQRLDLQKGDCVFLPSGMGNYLLSGTAEILLTKI